MIPAFCITADTIDVTGRLAKRMISLRLTDKPGMEADEVEIVLSDADGALNLPRRGATLRVAIGWQGELVEKGSFQVDEVSHSGPPDVLTIRARAAQFQGPLKDQREEAYDGLTLGEILTAIARRNNLVPAIEAGLAAIAIAHIDQTNESDANFLTRLGQDYDAIATIKGDHLLFMPSGHPVTLSGRPLTPVLVTRADTDRHDFTIADRGSYTGVRAKWRYLFSSATLYAIAGEEGGSMKTLKRDFPTEEEAQAAANAELARLRRGQKEIRLSLAKGRPEIIANRPLTLSGWRPEIDNTQWLAGEVVHTIADGGYVTEVTAQTAG
ncbi:contractile injection system protein, VgrG/Pvc8 family [Telmatospirillum sp. J64-1]|uniref:contractile injection system protein, VgrG/Pvc8 family n=1 Tax=Telmatospirillum sp. J64-1 TaxID=2502183 RepID=UPI00115E84CC|nr:contractile injection system protein, VgrG/Pvc8 family [Telmatospirillum sp. J64-1]